MLPCCGGQAPKCYAFYLDAERVAAEKTAAGKDAGVGYVSTNDILTSGFFSECGARIGMMGMDCRGRMEGIKPDMARPFAVQPVQLPLLMPQGNPGSRYRRGKSA